MHRQDVVAADGHVHLRDGLGVPIGVGEAEVGAAVLPAAEVGVNERDRGGLPRVGPGLADRGRLLVGRVSGGRIVGVVLQRPGVRAVVEVARGDDRMVGASWLSTLRYM
jgi:hypothetical protein